MLRHSTLPLLLSAAIGITASAGANADQVTDQIAAGLRAYEAGEARVAMQALQFAAAEIETQLRQRQLLLLPEPLPGWSAEDAVSESGGLAAMIAGTNLSRGYRNDTTGASVRITITADSPLLAMMGMMMASPMLMQANPGSSPFLHGSYRGMIEQNEDGTTKLSLMVGTRILVQIEGEGGADRQALEAYLQALDLPNLEKALLG
jgi:hypothetical protein